MTTLSDLTRINFARVRGVWRVRVCRGALVVYEERSEDLMVLARLLPCMLERFRDDTAPAELGDGCWSELDWRRLSDERNANDPAG